MIPNKHFQGLNKLSKNNLSILESLCNLYHIKTYEYIKRDRKNGKNVPFLEPREQMNRAYKVVSAWYNKK